VTAGWLALGTVLVRVDQLLVSDLHRFAERCVEHVRLLDLV
jgi:hypothetical protein